MRTITPVLALVTDALERIARDVGVAVERQEVGDFVQSELPRAGRVGAVQPVCGGGVGGVLERRVRIMRRDLRRIPDAPVEKQVDDDAPHRRRVDDAAQKLRPGLGVDRRGVAIGLQLRILRRPGVAVMAGIEITVALHHQAERVHAVGGHLVEEPEEMIAVDARGRRGLIGQPDLPAEVPEAAWGGTRLFSSRGGAARLRALNGSIRGGGHDVRWQSPRAGKRVESRVKLCRGPVKAFQINL